MAGPPTPVVGDGWSITAAVGLERLADREEDWRAALDGAATERLFLEPEWVLPWLERFGRHPRALFAGQRAAAIFDARGLGPGGTGPLVLRPPGLGISDYLDLILPADPAEAEAATAALIGWLVRAGGWALIDLPNLPDEWPTASFVGATATALGLPVLRLETYARPFVRLDSDWEGYLASRPQKLRYNLRARRRKLASLGEVAYRHYTAPEELDARLGLAVEIHARRWRGQHTSTTFSRSLPARRFYAEACRRMAARGRVDLSMLELDGRPIAFCLGFVYGGKYYYYLPAFEPEYAAYGPSVDLLAHLIEHAHGLGLRELDFMLGDEPYKEQWATGRRGTTRLVVGAPGSIGQAALATFSGYLALRERARRSAFAQRARRYGPGILTRALRR